MTTETKSRSSSVSALTSSTTRSRKRGAALWSKASDCDGFTVIELMVVIAIIGVLVSLLTPAIQSERHQNVRLAVEGDLQLLVSAANVFHQQTGNHANSLADLATFCAAHPNLCLLEAQLASGQKNGYSFKLSQPRNAGSSIDVLTHAPQIVAAPIHPGITGMDTVIANLDGSLLSFLTPGAEEAQQKAFDRIRAKGAETIVNLLRLNRDAPSRVRGFVNSDEGRTAAFNAIDSNDNGFVELPEIKNINTNTDLSLGELTTFVSDELKLDTLSQEIILTTKIDWSGLGEESIVSFDGVARLTSWYVSDPAIADSLSAKLRAAEAVEARGDARTKANMIRAYTIQVATLTCTTLTITQAATLAAMAMVL